MCIVYVHLLQFHMIICFSLVYWLACKHTNTHTTRNACDHTAKKLCTAKNQTKLKSMHELICCDDFVTGKFFQYTHENIFVLACTQFARRLFTFHVYETPNSNKSLISHLNIWLGKCLVANLPK